VDKAEELNVPVRRSKLLRTGVNIHQFIVADPSVCEVIRFTPREMAIVGKCKGATHVTFSFEDTGTPPVTYLVRVAPDPDTQGQCQAIEKCLAELFPDCHIQLVLAGERLLIQGQPRTVAEGAQILETARSLIFDNGAPQEDGTIRADCQSGADRRISSLEVVNMLRITEAPRVAKP
jgi:Flp pilus assembly secretin CpaC